MSESVAVWAAKWQKLESQHAELSSSLVAFARQHSKELAREVRLALRTAAKFKPAARGVALAALAQQEADARAELEVAQRRLHAITAQAISAAPARLPAKHTSKPQKSSAAPATAAADALPPEVTACDTFLARHGPTGGWAAEEHGYFLRIFRTCHGNIDHAIAICCESQLGLLHSRPSIEAHAAWHAELERLQMAKRLAVQRWRVQRAAAREAVLELPEAEAAKAAQAATRERQAQEQAVAKRTQQRQAAAEWRQGRELQQQREAALQTAEVRAAEERKRQACLARQEQNRQAIEGWRASRLAREESDCSIASAKSSQASMDPQTQARLEERNRQLMARRRNMSSRRSEQEQKAAARLEALQAAAAAAVAPPATRNPTRLLQLTAAAQLRQLTAIAEERGPKDSGFIRHMPKRATPTWCRMGR